jgi:tetratricopeptide (TPR) repeat protein
MKPAVSIFLLALSIWACTNEPASKQERLKDQAAWETEMRTKESLDTVLAQKMLDSYASFVKDFPEDSLAPELLIKMAEINKVYPNRFLEAIQNYEQVLKDYPKSPAAPRALVAVALAYEESGQTDRAASSYRAFLTSYPDHPLRSSVEDLLRMSTETEEIQIKRVQEWKKKSAQTTDNPNP